MELNNYLIDFYNYFHQFSTKRNSEYSFTQFIIPPYKLFLLEDLESLFVNKFILKYWLVLFFINKLIQNFF